MRTLITMLFTLIAAGGALAADDASQLGPTCADVAYGPDKMNVLDFWKAEGDGPRPLLVYIHGGGWIGGDKKLWSFRPTITSTEMTRRCSCPMGTT